MKETYRSAIKKIGSFVRRHRAQCVYGLMTVLIMGPLLVPGYILTLDMVFVPHPPLPSDITSDYAWQAVLHYASYMIPGDWLQKIILCAALYMSAWGMHRLLIYIWTVCAPATGRWTSSSFAWQVSIYFAGVFYVINPFVYGRFMAGQYLVLVGYCLLPFFARALFLLLDKPSFKRMVPVAGYAVIMSIVSIHTVGAAILLTLVSGSAWLWRHRTRQYVSALARAAAAGIGICIAASLYWIIPIVLGGSTLSQSADNFNEVHRQAFATDGGILNILQLKGFWAEAQGLFAPADSVLPLSGLWQMLVWISIALGGAYMWHRTRVMAVSLGVSAALAAILALGGPLNEWLAAHAPFFGGYREPHKFVALLALVFACAAFFGIHTMLIKLRAWKVGTRTAAVLLVVPLLVTPTMVWGCKGQLRAVEYPADWYAMNKRLAVNQNEYILFLPWHMYMPFHFTPKSIANPADKFFDARLLVSDDPEFAGISPQYASAVKTALSKEILPHAPARDDMAARLYALGIRYVLVAKEADYQTYAYINAQKDMQLVQDTPHLMLYRVVQ